MNGSGGEIHRRTHIQLWTVLANVSKIITFVVVLYSSTTK